ncbi:hypothetical protein WH52_10260 [Tenacibaculum holothuriorum]|uniref:2TM domain-containing protein n=1 Tax=Tenacibaculum holothuriorum TaxID=1635173 RepID=A0A1Y2PDC6_9FLAO|nr:2TM domain-containing protein [Tenacibaculum holothuriorum]OSY87797.1 hypothetical protein WH52_10260 [Tenacibaculum holothuriorum]
MKVIEPNTEEIKYLQAKKRVEALKGYYWHVAIYLIINTLTSWKNILRGLENGESIIEIFYDYKVSFSWIVWGIILIIHTIRVFGFNNSFTKNWEDRKIKEYMNKSS